MLKIFLLASVLFILGFVSFSQTTPRYEVVNKKICLKPEAITYYEKNLPAVVDNSQEIFFPPVYTQQHYVCNQVSASYYMFTYEFNRLRNLASNSPDRWFAVYYPWNWTHGGYGWYGGHVTAAFNLAKTQGMPFISESPADIARDSSVWISGYDNYYSYMQNRIRDYYYIDVSTYEGLMALKAWVYDHGRSETPGGLATFMTNIAWGGDNFLPSGTPEAGYYTITKCGDNPLHSRTVVGYHDGICWDYNGDGQYTNNIDLNGDGIIDVRDWEKGGFKVAESFGPDWQGNGGFLYIMYKCMADAFPEGGILNNEMAVIDASIDYTPVITAKLVMSHDCRDKVKISFGVSQNPNAIAPDHELDFSMVNYQGGNKYMQGGSSEADKTIELGYDLSPLLDYIEPGTPARFFVVARELDPHNSYNGAIEEFTIYRHHVCPPDEISWTGSVPFTSSLFYVPLNASINFDKPVIETQALPVFSANSPFTFFMEGSGGNLPYEWALQAVFDTAKQSYGYQYFTDEKISPDSYFDGIVDYELPFLFPWNGQLYSNIFVNSDGYIILGNDQRPWPYASALLDDFFAMERVIGPHMRFSFVVNPEYGDGIWVKQYSDHVSIRWNVSQQYLEPWTDCNFGINLYADGSVDMYYGPQYFNRNSTGIAGVSFGNNNDAFIISKNEMPASGLLYKITSFPVPTGVQLSQSGILTGNIYYEQPYPVRIRLSDGKGRSVSRDYQLITGIDNIQSLPFSIYPNPVPEMLIVTSEFDIEKLCCYDIFGRTIEVKHTVLNNQTVQLQLDKLVPGVYFLTLHVNNNNYIQRFIKQ